MHHPDPEKHRLLFRIGLFLVVANFPIGYGGLAFFTILATLTRTPELLWGGVLCYLLSWVMLGVGFWLGGRPAYDYARQFWRLRQRRSRLIDLRRNRAERRARNKA